MKKISSGRDDEYIILQKWLEKHKIYYDLDLLKKLDELDLSNREVTYIPKEIYLLRNLDELSLENNKIKKIPSEIGSLTKLTHLDLSNNQIRIIPESITNLRKLVYLNLQGNPVEKIPELGKLQTLCNSILMGGYSEDYIFSEMKLNDKFFLSCQKFLKTNQKDNVVKCLKGHQIKKIMGKGGYGTVYHTCFKDKCNYAVKVANIEKPQYRVAFEREVTVFKILEPYEIGPELVHSWVCEREKLGVIVMEMWDGNLMQQKKCPDIPLIEVLFNQIKRLHSLNMVHTDILPKNILVRLNKNGLPFDITLADWGLVNTTQDLKRSNKDWLEKIFEYHKRSGNKQIFEDFDIGIEDIIRNPKILDFAMLYNLLKCYQNTPQFKKIEPILIHIQNEIV